MRGLVKFAFVGNLTVRPTFPTPAWLSTPVQMFTRFLQIRTILPCAEMLHGGTSGGLTISVDQKDPKAHGAREVVHNSQPCGILDTLS